MSAVRRCSMGTHRGQRVCSRDLGKTVCRRPSSSWVSQKSMITWGDGSEQRESKDEGIDKTVIRCMRSRVDSVPNAHSLDFLGKGKGCGFISVLPASYSESSTLLIFNKYLLNERHFLQVILSYRIILYVVNLPNTCGYFLDEYVWDGVTLRRQVSHCHLKSWLAVCIQ